ncbi:TniQ family protein [Nocardia sp. CA-120079]|uniref:TniQ family protein n=1 Tax=Nocardia sp. CA-120079 TaxID=3239974 RepID=UPI003D995FDC
MTEIRTLPIRVAPVPGEALDSWLEAVAARSHTAWADLLTAVGLLKASTAQSSNWVFKLRPQETAAIATATGIAATSIAAMTLARFDEAAVSIDTRSRKVLRTFPWGRGRGSRYCPGCLADTGGRWQLSWRLGWSFVCARHQCLLVDHCPGCGQRPRLRTMPGDVVPMPGHCNKPGHGTTGRALKRCGTDLTATPVTRFPADHPVLCAQRTVYDVIDAGTAEFGIYATSPRPTVTALADIRAVAGRVLAYGSGDSLSRVLPADLLAAHGETARERPTPAADPRQARRPGLVAPARAATAAVGVTAALAALTKPSIGTAGDALRWLIIDARERGRAVNATNIGWGQGTSPTLTAVQLAALAPLLRPSEQLRYRTASSMPGRPATRSSRSQQLVRRTPTMLWEPWSLPLALPGCHQHQLRLAVSAVLLLIGTRLRLQEAAEVLNSPIDHQGISRVVAMFENHSDWPLFQDALTRMSDYLADTEIPIDYRRRRTLDYTDLLPDSVWRQICRGAGTPGQGASRARVARCFLFERLSGMPASAAPDAVDQNLFRTRTADFPQHLTPELATALHEYAADFLAHQHIHDEPPSWQPPIALLDDLRLPIPDPKRVDIDKLHRLVRQEDRSLGAVADVLGTTLDTVRHLLEIHPAPARQPATAHEARAQGRAYMVARSALSRETFIVLYQQQRISLREIAAGVGVSRKTLARLAHDYDIPLREPHHHARIHIDRDWLYDQYVNQRRTLPDLARDTGMSTANMARWAKHHEIPLRPRGGPSHSASLDANMAAADAPINLQPTLTGIGGWERLQRFAAACRYPTLTIAAEELGVGKAALVTQINRLERELGGPLLNRAERNRPMTTTTLGEEILAAIRVASGQ